MNQKVGKPTVFIALLVLLSMTTCQTVVLMDNSIESDLKVIMETSRIPPELSITYTDLHGLWGGIKITVTGAGNSEIQERDSSEAETRVLKGTVEQDQLLELVKLIVELKAWEQRTPERQPRPDESRSTFTINTGAHSSATWEWFDDMEKDQRLIKIKTKMTGMVKKN